MRINNRYSGKVLFEADVETMKECLAAAIEAKVKLLSADFSGADLSDTNFRGVYLRCAKFHRANLRGATLRSCDISCADFRRADLSNTDMRDTNTSGTNFRGANLTGADRRCVKPEFVANLRDCSGEFVDDRPATKAFVDDRLDENRRTFIWDYEKRDWITVKETL